MKTERPSVMEVLDRLRAVSDRDRGYGQSVWVLNADVVTLLDFFDGLKAGNYAVVKIPKDMDVDHGAKLENIAWMSVGDDDDPGEWFLP